MEFLKHRTFLVCLVACVVALPLMALANRDRNEPETHIATYFKLLESKDASLLDYYEQLASKSFTCQWRDERVHSREEWAATLKAYLSDVATTLKYEYRVVSTLPKGSDRVVIRVVATEIRSWQDRQGLFGPAGHTLQYRESFDIDFVFIKREGVWLWEQLILYGLDKRAHEQVQ